MTLFPSHLWPGTPEPPYSTSCLACNCDCPAQILSHLLFAMYVSSNYHYNILPALTLPLSTAYALNCPSVPEINMSNANAFAFTYIYFLYFFEHRFRCFGTLCLVSYWPIFPLAPSCYIFLLSKLTLGLNTCRQSWCHADCSPVPLYTSSLLDLVLLCPGHNIYLWLRMFDL